MDETIATPSKKTTRSRKTTATQANVVSDTTPAASGAISTPSSMTQIFEDLMVKISQSREEYESLQRQIEQTKKDWVSEQKQYELGLVQQKTQEEVERKREQETYEYNISLSRKRAEDEFTDKKLAWEKELSQRKEELVKEKQELEHLRKLVADFENQKEQAVKEAQVLLERELTEKFNQEKTLREQEIKSEKEILGLKIANSEAENSRLNKELEVLKRSLDEATRQVKEIAVKVIESGSNQQKPQITPES